jgi:hypothetical protein
MTDVQLVPVTAAGAQTAIANGYTVYTTTITIPASTVTVPSSTSAVLLAPVGWQTPIVTPPVVTPPPVITSGPSGFTHPSVPAGMTEVLFDDFTETTLNTKYWGGQGAGKNAEGAFWLPSHVVLSGSCLNLEGYPDTSLVGQWGVTASELAGVNNFVGGEQGTASGFPLGPGTRILTAMRADMLPGFAYLCLVTALADHRSEGDFVEAMPPGTEFTATIHSSKPQISKQTNFTFNLTDWMVWGIQWTPSTIEFLVQLTPSSPLTVWWSEPNPDPTGTWAESQFLSLQMQTNDSIYGANDPQFPAVNSSITASNPIRQQHDWVQICTGAT